MKLGKYFTLSEMIVTNSKLLNLPNVTQIDSLKELIKNVLDPLREMYGKSIHVNSAFRSLLVNKAVGGAATSQHTKGEAADIDNGKDENIILFNLIRDNFDFDQLINESDYSWVHVSYKKSGNRKEVLKMVNGKYTEI